MENERIEEMLELLWTLKEAGQDSLEAALEKSEDEAPKEVFDALVSQDLATVRDGKVSLSSAAEKRAREIVRRCRLAETLLAQVLDLEDRDVRDTACKFEHVLSSRVTESICTFLGHPPVCPHGKPIPRGPCCLRAETQMRPLVSRLTDMDLGAEVSIVFIAPVQHETLDRLGGFGVVPGRTLRVHQKRPSFVIQVGETTVALDEEIAREIFVKNA
ncbi:MAG: metal-dependent transcriptional regulator [Candidatus Eiseniibacteriota bacterium]|nr:MAG: metal-dependent transcriptional regulator [Candidatus Eisenbacteria bacterium]